MIQILENGKYKKKISYYKDTCENCGCKFRFDAEDAKYNYEFCSQKQIQIIQLKIQCPYCGMVISKFKNDFEYVEEEIEISGDKGEKLWTQRKR